MTLRDSASFKEATARTDRSAAAAQPVAIEVLVCGSFERGDDGAPTAAAHLLRDHLREDVRVRIVSQLDIDDLLAVPPGARVVVVDAVVGIRPGQIVELPLTGLAGRDDRLRPRSSHALTLPEILGLAALIRGRPLKGRIVAIGGKAFGLGADLSPRVARAIPALAAAVREAMNRDRD
jgi:hydrogenase maturation protease